MEFWAFIWWRFGQSLWPSSDPTTDLCVVHVRKYLQNRKCGNYILQNIYKTFYLGQKLFTCCLCLLLCWNKWMQWKTERMNDEWWTLNVWLDLLWPLIKVGMEKLWLEFAAIFISGVLTKRCENVWVWLETLKSKYVRGYTKIT